jgi:outer membrane protein OmpA-like peptidoglycan-associated protein
MTMKRKPKLMRAASAIALCTTMAVTSLSAQTLGGVGADSRAKAIGEMTDARVMEVLRSDGRVAMSGQFFETDSTEFSSKAPEILFKMAKAMETLPEMRLAIIGHTDSVGDFAYNVDLSQRRAEAVRQALLVEPNNVAPERLVAMGAGPINPVASNLSDEGRALNRRVEFVLIDEELAQ